jgi:hypothetical protein
MRERLGVNFHAISYTALGHWGQYLPTNTTDGLINSSPFLQTYEHISLTVDTKVHMNSLFLHTQQGKKFYNMKSLLAKTQVWEIFSILLSHINHGWFLLHI